MWSYGFYVILSGCGAFPPETARDVVFRCVHLFGKSCVVARAAAVKPGGSVDVKIRMTVTRTKTHRKCQVNILTPEFLLLFEILAI